MFPTFDSQLGYIVLGWFQLGVVPDAAPRPPVPPISNMLLVPEPVALPGGIPVRMVRKGDSL